MPNTKSFHEVVRDRHSVRAFLPDVVPDALVRAVVEEAQLAPSNCNTQPWHVHIVSGDARDRLSAALIAADDADHMTLDFPFIPDADSGAHVERLKAQGAAYYQAMGVPREAIEERRNVMRRNLCFFDAPQVALLFMPDTANSVRVAGDIGMYGQTFLLSLTAHGLGGIPQTVLGMYADTIRETLNIDPSQKMLFGISFGYPDPDHPANVYRIDKANLEETVTFHR